jgi:hypothetical protein
MVFPDLLSQIEIVKQLRVAGTLNPDHDMLSVTFYIMELSHKITFLTILDVIKLIYFSLGQT